jgi:CheY-like chemotaxis protein
MTPEVRARLFEPFFTTKAVGKGTGLGMPVVLGIVQRLGGAIAVDSNPGKGTQVEVWLPICGDVAQPVAAEPAAARSTGLAAAHVLVVEDQPMNAELARRRLESLGLRVTVHESSLAALADFRSRPQAFDLMLTDNSMPGMTGLMLAKHVTSERPSLPVLMVSGYAENADLEVLRQHGIATVLRKPHSLKDLGEAIQKLLARR